MQEDTYRGDGLNLYAYCANNSVVYYDPSGKQKCTKPQNAELICTISIPINVFYNSMNVQQIKRENDL